jgi:hypothetical protein
MGYSSLCVTTVFSTPTNSLTHCSQTGLFSAAVASLISVSIQDLQQNPQVTSNFYLANIYQATINPNASSSLPSSPPPFSPPNYAVWVNTLWFLSLAISLTCALLATLLQQWARRYLKVTQSRYSLHKRARIRAFFAEGVEKLLLPRAVEILPGLLHISLFLFFAGLVVFLQNINLTIFKLVLSWVGVCTALYGCVTVIPIFRHDSPYYTSLSSLLWHIIIGIRCVVAQVYGFFVVWRLAHRPVFAIYRGRYYAMLLQGMQRISEETALKSPSEIDTRAFMWTFDCLDEDHELERFFSGLPGFRRSNVVKDPLPDLTPEQQEKLLYALAGLSNRTSSSDLLPEPVKIRRSFICGKAIGPEDIPREIIRRVLSKIVYGDPCGLVQSGEIIPFVRGWDNGEDEGITTITRAILSSVVARAQRRDDLWFVMASDELGVPEPVLRDHATYGNNLSLAILIHVVRQQFSLYWQPHWPREEFSKVLEEASKFDAQDTSLELQHKFCELWNELIRNLASPGYILSPIRNIYLSLHLHTDSAPTGFSASTTNGDLILWKRSVYPSCNVSGHHTDPTPQIHDATTSTAIAHAVLHDNSAQAPSSLASAPSASSSFVPAPVHVDENPKDAPLLGNMSVPATLYHTHHTATESAHDSATSPDPAATSLARNNPSTRTIVPSTRETSTPTSFVLVPAVVSPQNHTEPLVHFDAPEILSSDPPEPVLDGITGMSLSTSRLLSQGPLARH